MATKSKTQSTDELAEALYQIFGKIDDLNTSLCHARGAANACELVGDESSDGFIQAALLSIADQGQKQIDAAKAIVEEIAGIIKKATTPVRTSKLEAEARLAGGAS